MDIEFNTAFQMTNIPVLFQCGSRSQSIKFSGAMYFGEATMAQRLFEVINFHPSLAASVEEKSSSFLMPQPPHFFGRVSDSHLAQAHILPA